MSTDKKSSERFIIKAMSVVDVFEKSLANLSTNEKIEFFKKFMTGKGESGGRIYDHIDYDNIPAESLVFRMVYHVMMEEGEGVFDSNIPKYTDGELSELKAALSKPDISDDEIWDLTDKYSVLNKDASRIILEVVGRDRLEKMRSK